MSLLIRMGGKFQGLVLACLSAVLLSVCFFPVGVWNNLRAFAAWFALAPLYIALAPAPSRSLRSVAATGYCFGLLLHLLGAYWLNAIGTVPYLCVAVIEAVWFVLFALAYTFLLRFASPRSAPLVFAALWVLFEWMRTQGAYAFPWFPLAATQAADIPSLQLCAVTGQWGLSFLLAWGCALCGEIALSRKLLPHLGTVLALVLLTHIYGVWAAPKEPVAVRSVRVAVAQGSYAGSDDAESRQIYLDLTRQATILAGHRLDLAVWPETVVGPLLDSPGALGEVSDTARSLQTAILVGTERRDRNSQTFNTTVLIGRRGQVSGFYDKIVIVPLGEFFPLREIFGPIYMKYPTGSNDLTRGQESGVLKGDETHPANGETFSFGTLICYESAFGWRARQEVLQGAQFLTVSTNDLWFGVSAGPLQHADLSSLRAVETRRWIARAASSGESRLIEPSGRIVQSLPLMKRDAATAQINLRDDKTPYVLYGDWFMICCLALLAMCCARRKR